MTRWLKWFVWSMGLLAYVVAVFERTTLGVAMVEATSRFHAGASVVSLFTVLQLVVYAGMQVPCGIALDRFGSRKLLATGALVMALAQAWMAVAGSVPEAIGARVLVGLGDAMTFGAAVRLVPAWFAPKQIPFLTQLTGLAGQFGQIASAVPFALVLHAQGWRTAFLLAAACSAVAAATSFFLVWDDPSGGRNVPRARAPRRVSVREEMAAVWRVPGTRLGMWTHLLTGFAPMVFAMAWGFPYLTQAEGLSGATASGLMTVFVIGSCFFGPTLGMLTQRHPLRRSNLALGIAALNLVPWVLVCLWPGHAPLWLLVVLVLGLSSGGPGSAIGFDFARTFNPERRLGTATGLVIVGAFAGALVCILAIGIIVDALGATGLSTLTTYRVAMAVQLPVFAFGTVALLAARRKTRARMLAEGTYVPTWREALAREFSGTWWWRRVNAGTRLTL